MFFAVYRIIYQLQPAYQFNESGPTKEFKVNAYYLAKVFDVRNRCKSNSKACTFKGTVHPREKLFYYWTDLCENLIQAVKGRKNSFCSWHFFDRTDSFFNFGQVFEMFPFR